MNINLAKIYSVDRSRKENDMYDQILFYDPKNIKIICKKGKKITI